MSEQTPPTTEIKSRESRPPFHLLRSLGRRGLDKLIGPSAELTPLPEGYRYKNPKFLKPKALGRLFQQVEMGKDFTDYFQSRRDAWARSEGLRLVEVAVGDSKGNLVGYGSINYRGDEGNLADFVVSPDHQGKGIGKAIILERLRIAEEIGLKTLRVPKPEDTNTLHSSPHGENSFYLELGFQQSENGDLIRQLPQPSAGAGEMSAPSVPEPTHTK